MRLALLAASLGGCTCGRSYALDTTLEGAATPDEIARASDAYGELLADGCERLCTPANLYGDVERIHEVYSCDLVPLPSDTGGEMGGTPLRCEVHAILWGACGDWSPEPPSW